RSDGQRIRALAPAVGPASAGPPKLPGDAGPASATARRADARRRAPPLLDASRPELLARRDRDRQPAPQELRRDDLGRRVRRIDAAALLHRRLALVKGLRYR